MLMLVSFCKRLHVGVGFVFIRLLIEGKGKTWKQDQRIRLQHVDTGAYLHSHNKKYTGIAEGQQEVRNKLESNNLFYSIIASLPALAQFP